MIYHIFYEWLFKSLSAGGGGESYFVKALNVFQYVTFRTAYAAVTALLISLVFGGRVIESLRRLAITRISTTPTSASPRSTCRGSTAPRSSTPFTGEDHR